MSNSSQRSFWSRLGSVIALAFATLVLVACGGGGSADPMSSVSTPTTGVSQAQSCGATVTNVTVDNFSGTNAAGVSVNPKFTGSVTVTGAGCGDAAPKVTIRLDVMNCPGSQSVDATVTMASVSAGTFVATPSTLGNALTCQFTVNPAVNGKAGTTLTGSFTTEAVPVATAYTSYDMRVAVNGIRGTLSYVERDGQGKRALTPFTNKTGYDIVALCGVPYVGDNVWIHDDGVARFSCVTPTAGNLRRTFKMIGKGELGSEDLNPLPANVVLRDVRWGTDQKYVTYGIGALGQYLDETDGVLYTYGNDLRFAVGGTVTGFASPEIISSDYVQFLARVKH